MTRTCRILAPAPWRSRGKDCGLMCKIPRSQHLMASSSSLLLAHGSTIQGRMHRYDEFCSWPDPTDRRWNGKREIKNQKLLRDDQFVGQNCQGHWGLLGGVRNGRNNFETWKRPPRPQEPRPATSSWYFVISMAAFHWLSAVALAGFGEGHCGPDRIPSNPTADDPASKPGPAQL